MSNLEIKATEMIAIKKNGNSKEFLDTFIFEPENIDEQNLGSLYIIGEITEISPNSEYLINLLVATIKKEYYANTAHSPIVGLESALNKTNEMLADFAEKGNIDWIGHINIIIAVLKDSTLYFSQTGRAKAFLIREKKIINIGQDLVSDLKPHPLKTFSNIANGQIDVADKLIFATSRLTEVMEEKEIRDIFLEDSDKIISQLENRLKHSGTALVIIKAEEKIKLSGAITIKKILTDTTETTTSDNTAEVKKIREYSQKYPSHKNRLDDIIHELNDAERETGLSHKIKFTAKVIRFTIKSTENVLSVFLVWTKKTSVILYNFLKPKIITGAQFIKNKINNLIVKVVTKVKIFFSKSNYQKENNKKEIIYAKLENFQTQEKKQNKIPVFFTKIYFEKIKNLPTKTKTAFITIIILFIMVGLATIGLINKNKENEKEIFYAKILANAKKAEIATESILIYENKEEATELIRQIFADTNQLILSGYFIDEAKQLQKKSLEFIEKIDRVTKIDNPIKLIDFAANSQNIKTDGIIWSGKSLYAFNSSNNALYKYNFAQKNSQILAINSENMGHLKTAKLFGNKIIFLTDSPGVAIYDPVKSELKNIPIKLNETEMNMVDIDIFGSNLYVLEKSDSNIYKHLLTTGGYSKGEKWLLGDANQKIRNPVSISIDGDLYLLQNTDNANEILKFTKGIKKELEISPLIIPMINAVKIITAGMTQIYILDPANKRAIIFSKNGKESRQITSEKFDNLIDFAVNPNEKSIYFLNSTILYEVPL